MIYRTFNINFADLVISRPDIETVLGYKENDDRSLVSDLINDLISESSLIAAVKAEYAVFDNIVTDENQKTITIGDVVFDPGKIVFNQLKRSTSVALFLCTAGNEIGERSKTAMKETDFLKGYIYDVIGSAIADAAADVVQNDIEKEAVNAGFAITNRYSPGYCDWTVAEQQNLFTLLPGNFCGIRLLPSSLMEPVKSVSGIIGIGKNVRFNNYTCNICDMKDCVYRSIKQREKL
jgi:hypothetical protein